MWIFLNNACLSIVAHRDNPEKLLVRARFQWDIEEVFNGVDVVETPNADYRFSAEVDRERVAEVLAAHVEAIEYDSFKSSVRSSWRHDLYLKVWSILRAAQDKFAIS